MLGTRSGHREAAEVFSASVACAELRRGGRFAADVTKYTKPASLHRYGARDDLCDVEISKNRGPREETSIHGLAAKPTFFCWVLYSTFVHGFDSRMHIFATRIQTMLLKENLFGFGCCCCVVVIDLGWPWFKGSSRWWAPQVPFIYPSQREVLQVGVVGRAIEARFL